MLKKEKKFPYFNIFVGDKMYQEPTMSREEVKEKIEEILGTVIVEEVLINDEFRFDVDSVMVGTYYLDYYYEGSKADNIELEIITKVELEGSTLKVWTY
jgi:ribosomal protein S24E